VGDVPRMTDADPFDAFVREFQDMVFATAVRLVGNPHDAEDVAQIVFLKAFERFDRIGGSASAAGWLKTVTTNTCLNHLTRYKKRWRLFSELERPEGPRVDAGVTGRDYASGIPAAASASPDFESDRAGSDSALEEAVRRLPDHQRVPLVLFHFEQRSYQEIAGLLGISVGKVKTDIHRGREALRTSLAG